MRRIAIVLLIAFAIGISAAGVYAVGAYDHGMACAADKACPQGKDCPHDKACPHEKACPHDKDCADKKSCPEGKDCPSCEKAASGKKATSAVCPVMGKKIADVKKAAAKSTYKGKTYYFCCKGCKPKFDKNPEKYIKSSEKVSAVCPVMGSKIPDVKKAAGKSVYKGKTYYFCCAGCKPKFDKDPEKYVGSKK